MTAIVITNPDHYYTANLKDMSDSGYRFEGIAGYLYPENIALTTTLHHWFNLTVCDNFTPLASHTYLPQTDTITRALSGTYTPKRFEARFPVVMVS
ncbi:hypothetical protein BGZ47_008765 [Haplosporangium gracile]|nr:hypothetical protein BGZ47_008765 [Haplosporangium gracile]